MIPGLSAVPVFLPKKGIVGTPFALSGGFETGVDEWSFVNGSFGRSDSGGAQVPRSGLWCLVQTWGGAEIAATRTIAASIAKGCRITASIYARLRDGHPSTYALQYRIGNGPITTLQTGSAYTYTLLTGSFDNPGDEPISILINANYFVGFDDWAISGTPL